MKHHFLFTSLFLLLLWSCNKKQQPYDAFGTFEGVETIVSSEATGNILSLDIEEGMILEKGTIIGYIDSIQLTLKKKQLQAQINAILSKKPNASLQLSALNEQLKQAKREQTRFENLYKSNAATRKQVDDLNSQVAIITQQILALESTLNTTVSSLNEETIPLTVQMEITEDLLSKCRIINPVTGTVLTKYAISNEVIASGKPLYKIADLSQIILRAYITGDQFSQIKNGQKVKVFVDDVDGKYRQYTGVVEWVSDKAEFTPKTIQTKDERANLVYAVKIKVPNDGLLKIGMYGEVKL
jgi:HlyD family secretion protein